MMLYKDILALHAPFTLAREEKRDLFQECLMELTEWHRESCELYRRMLETVNWRQDECHCLEDFPFLPVRLFKEFDLRSVGQDDVFKVMTSSGTSGQAVSKIYLDKETAALQQKTLARIVSDFAGTERLPMIIIDCPSVVKNREMFSARGAGILGFSIFGRKKIYALDDDMNLDLDGIRTFLAENSGKKILLFGFTFMIWQHFYKELHRLAKRGERIDLSQGILIHGGGWKKLTQHAVSSSGFRAALQDVCGLRKVANYYGMVEQTGCIYMECEEGQLHASTYSDIIIRRGKDFSVADFGEPGIIETISLLPRSYPGHLLLTEDEGVLLGEDDCPCGRKGKYFNVNGRLKNAEIRGCSDTYAAKF